MFTAERVAYRNLLLGISAPGTATRHNPFREWIGAQIRTDVYGWVHPGDPAAAARAAWTDARLSHVRNGVYGAMAVAAMCATPSSPTAEAVDDVVATGLAVVPPESRYAEALRFGVDLGHARPATGRRARPAGGAVRPPALGARAEQRRADGVRPDRESR